MLKTKSHLFGAKGSRLLAGVLAVGGTLAVALGLYSFAGGNKISMVPASSGLGTSYGAQTPFQLIHNQALEGCPEVSFSQQELGNLILVSQNPGPASSATLLPPTGTGTGVNEDQFNKPVRTIHDPYPDLCRLGSRFCQ